MQESKILLQKTLGNIIKQHRELNKKSISLIANEIILSKSVWSEVEKGNKDPQFSTIWRMAEALEIPLSDLIKEIEAKLDGKLNFIDE